MEYLCKERVDCSRLCFAKFLQILNNLYKLLASEATLASSTTASSNRPLQLQIERLARHLIVDASSMHDKNAIYDTFIRLVEEEEADKQNHNNTDVPGTSTTLSSTSETTTTSSSSSYLSEQLQFIM